MTASLTLCCHSRKWQREKPRVPESEARRSELGEIQPLEGSKATAVTTRRLDKSLEVSMCIMEWISKKNGVVQRIAHANSLSEHGYKLRRKIEACPRKAAPEWCYNDQGLQGYS